MEANHPQPVPTALTASEGTITVRTPPSAPALATMRVEIEALLDDATRREFTNTIALVMKLGNKKPKFLGPRRRKIRNIVEENTQIVELYNKYVKAHMQKEKRLTYRLPVFEELEAQVRAAEAQMRQMEIEPQENEDVDMEDAAGIMDMVAAEKVMPEQAATITTANAHHEDAGITAAQSDIPEPAVTIAKTNQDAQAREGQGADGTAPCTVVGESVITAQSLPQPILKPNELVTPIVNTEAFPINRIQDVQALRYPLAKITGVWAHRKTCGDVVQVTIDMQDGPVDHLIINDVRIITAFGLREGNDFITIHEPYLKHMETFNIRIFPNQHVRNVKAFDVGEMVSARHAYLCWLEFRGSADPKGEPWAQEARKIAVQIGRRALDVWKEIDGYWQLEHGSGGRMYRENRMKYLGEDPVIDGNDLHEKKKIAMSVWG
ncbi:hypothetical protein BKA63DRAFT_460833 [Paraphoma chrysanthemicola]|nr:hypothetical protein BKA63DRAFT_460833 [Paraphoma chrysanthemicola]